jgi:hypothetical protein
MRRTRTLLGVGALLFLALAVVLAHRAEGQDGGLQPPSPVPTAPETAPPSIYNAPAQASALAAPGQQLKGETIDALLSRLEAVKSQKEQLERVEKELTAVLKEKYKEQKQRLQKLGVQVEEPPAAVPASVGAASFSPPTEPVPAR